MNEGASAGPEAEIVEKIQTDARAEAKRILEGASRARDMELGKAANEGQRIRGELLAEAARKARAVRSKEIATAHIEAKRLLLGAREDAITTVMQGVGREVARVRETPERYRAILGALAAEAVVAVGEAEVELRVGRRDEALVDDGFLRSLEARVRETTGTEVRVSVEVDSSIDAGCVAVGRGGRVVFDNSFSRRLEMAKLSLRAMIVSEVLKTDV